MFLLYYLWQSSAGDTNVAEFPDEQQSSFSDESDVALGNEDLTTSSDNGMPNYMQLKKQI